MLNYIVEPGCWNGRQCRLKICCPQGREGSTPSPGTFSGCSSSAERCVWDADVGGSIPLTPTNET